MPAAANEKSTEVRELHLTRTFDAPRDLVWKAWTDAKHVAMWWGPHSFANPVCDVDPKPGGAFRIHMRAPDGTIYPSDGTFREVVPPERLSFTTGVTDVMEVLTTVRFEATGRNKTTIHLDARVLWAKGPAAQYLAGMEEGWSQSLERLAVVATPEAERSIIATRLYRAPRELVFKMWSDPEHIARWWGPEGFTNTIHKMEFRPGGEWIFIMHGPDGRNYDNHITYEEIVAPERIVYTHDSTPKFRVTVTFTEQMPGVTRLTMAGVFATAELRDNTVRAFNAAEGMHQTLGRLDLAVQQEISG